MDIELVILWIAVGSLAVNVIYAINFSIIHDTTVTKALLFVIGEVLLWPVSLLMTLKTAYLAIKKKRDHSSW